MKPGPEAWRVFTICNARGLHARSSAKFVKCADGFNASVRVRREGQTVSGGSIMGLMMLGAAKGATIEISTSGPQATEALQALAALINSGFGEN